MFIKTYTEYKINHGLKILTDFALTGPYSMNCASLVGTVTEDSLVLAVSNILVNVAIVCPKVLKINTLFCFTDVCKI